MGKGAEPRGDDFLIEVAPIPVEVAPVASEPDAKAVADEESAAAREKKDKAPKKVKEQKGLNPSEEAELESLKKQIIEKKQELKAQGLSGGQQNKDEDVVRMVARMNELKEK